MSKHGVRTLNELDSMLQEAKNHPFARARLADRAAKAGQVIGRDDPKTAIE